MPRPIRVGINAGERYSIMWLAGVRHVDLDQHCLRTFGEADRPRVNPRAFTQSVELPAENQPLAWYLCALPIPWAWERNAHLAFEYAPGEQWQGPALVRNLHVTLDNARPITGWGEDSIPADAKHRHRQLYRTCRNWQFGWWLRQNRDAPDAPPHPTYPRPEGGPQQMTIL